MKQENTFEKMIEEGYTKKFAAYWLNGIKAEQLQYGELYDEEYAEWAHSEGFFAAHAYLYGLSPSNVENYLSDYDYYLIWPINNWTRIWINDKLTLKYALHGTEFGELMPEYYFYSDISGLRALMDNQKTLTRSQDMNGFLDLLKNKGQFACKPNNGTESRGFFKLSYEGGLFFINDSVSTQEDIIEFVHTHNNYIFTEYITPSSIMAKICPQIHTLRVVTINRHGNDPRLIAAFLRYPNKTSGVANYNVFEAGAGTKFNVYTNCNIETGAFEQSKMVYANRSVLTNIHPDSGVILGGMLPSWKKISQKILEIAYYFSSIEYMGFDFGITDNGYKLMEINSHPGINTQQSYFPFYQDDFLESYFKDKIDAVKQLSDEEKRRRSVIPR